MNSIPISSKLNPLDLKVSCHWRHLEFLHNRKEFLFISKDGKRSNDVCVDRVDLVTEISYTPGWLTPDGPKVNLTQSLRKFFGDGNTFATVASKVGRAVAAYRAIVQIIDSFVPTIRKGNFSKLQASRLKLWVDILGLAIDNKMEKSLKNDFQQLLALGTGKTKDRSLSVFSGFIRRLLLTRATRMLAAGDSAAKEAAFIRSLYESKRCWHEMSDELRTESMDKHKKLLGSIKECDVAAQHWIMNAVDLVIPFGTKYEPGGMCVPTWSASFETSRGDGGNHSATLGFGRLFDLGGKGVGEQIRFSNSFEDVLIKRSAKLENDVKYQAIPEPGKFRVITVGREEIYSGLRVFQRFLIDAWKSSPFGTMTEDVLEKILRLRDEEGSVYFSGDYDSATDALSLTASNVCISRILYNLGLSDTPLGMLAWRSFQGASIHYPDGEVVKQTRGQLMGHPLSFPLLCIINLSTFMRTYQIVNMRDKRISRVLINGDDILFKGEKSDGQRWREAADAVGLIVNEAKTYESHRWALINSIFVDMTKGRKVNYVPLSVSIGHNVKRGEITKTLSQAPAIWALIEACPNERSREMCRRIYLRSLASLLPKFKGFTPNYFLRKEVGGLGMIPSVDWKFGVSYAQRKAATYYMKNRSVNAIREKIYDMPKAVKLALEKLGKICPVMEDWVIDGRPVHGPIPEHEDVEVYLENMMPLLLRSTAWVVGAGENVERIVSHRWKEALSCKEVPVSEKKLRAYTPARQVCRLPKNEKRMIGEFELDLAAPFDDLLFCCQGRDIECSGPGMTLNLTIGSLY